MTDLESRLHIAIGVAQSLQRPLWPTTPIGSDGVREMAEKIESALRAAVEEIRELRADRERLDWVQAGDHAYALNNRGGSAAYGGLNRPEGCIAQRETIREAIDAARAQAEGGGDE